MSFASISVDEKVYRSECGADENGRKRRLGRLGVLGHFFFLRDQLAALPVGFIIKYIGKSPFSKFCERPIYISLIYSKL